MEKIEKRSFEVLRRSFECLDHDSDGKVTMDDIEKSCGISNEEAKVLFDSLSVKGESFIEFQEFCEGVLRFPTLLERFEGEHEEQDFVVKVLDLLKIDKSLNEEEQFELISSEIWQVFRYDKDQIVSLAQGLFYWVNSLRESVKMLEQRQTTTNIEHCLQIENMIRDRKRCEKTYEDLAQEFKVLEKVNKELEEKLLNKENEIREINLKLSHKENEIESMNSSIVSLNYLIESKEKVINDLTKKINVNNALVHINTISRETREKSIKKFSKTPRGLRNFTYESKDFDSAKDHIIKNLKAQLTEKINLCQQFDWKVTELQRERSDLIEKVKILSLRSKQCSEEEESFRLDTLESLRDELVIIDSGFIQTKTSFQMLSLQDVGIQVDRQLERKKGRYSCFSFFS